MAVQTASSSEVVSDAPYDESNGIGRKEVGELAHSSDVISETNPSSVMEAGPAYDNMDQLSADVGDLWVKNDIPANESTVDEKHTLSVEDVDTCLDNCLLQALHTTVKDKDLPMPGSTLWLLGTMLDIKKSSHKKLSKWLQAKSSAGLARKGLRCLFKAV